MSEPFYRSRKTIDKIALVVAIVSLFIFIFSCLFSVYSYSITPTITPSPTFTATATRTPRPSNTPTVTATITITATEITPSQTTTATLSPIFDPVLGLLDELSVSGFICDYPLVENDSLMVVCEKESENYQTQLTLKYDLPAEIQFNSASININPVLEVTSEVLLSEITWLTELPFYRFELPTPTSTTPTETLEITETLPVKEINELTTWLSENLPLLTNENSLEYAFHDVLYSISIQSEVLVLNIARVDTQ